MDTKSAWVLGSCIIIAALVVALLPRSTMAPAGTEVGRYQLVRSNGVNCFVPDTRTGRLWQRHVEPNGGPSDWSENKSPWGDLQRIGVSP
jgi:hypothetical protein